MSENDARRRSTLGPMQHGIPHLSGQSTPRLEGSDGSALRVQNIALRARFCGAARVQCAYQWGEGLGLIKEGT